MQQWRRGRRLWSHSNSRGRSCSGRCGRLQYWLLNLCGLYRLHDNRLLRLCLSGPTGGQRNRPGHRRSSRWCRLLLPTDRDRTRGARCGRGRVNPGTGTLPVITARRGRHCGHCGLRGTLPRLNRGRVAGRGRRTPTRVAHWVQRRWLSALEQTKSLHLLVQLLLGLWSVLDNDRLSTAAIGQLHTVEDNATGRG